MASVVSVVVLSVVLASGMCSYYAVVPHSPLPCVRESPVGASSVTCDECV